MTKEFRTYVEDVDRTLYDISDATDPSLRLDAGLTPDIVREISAKKDEPSWMLDFRLKALDTYQRMEAPDWGPASKASTWITSVTVREGPATDQQARLGKPPRTT